MRILRDHYRWCLIILVMVHLFGLLGIWLAPQFFLPWTPANLLLSGVLVLGSHEHTKSPVSFVAHAIGVGLGGWLIEWIGVHGEWVFGSYAYLETLGWKWQDVPLVIAVNWVLLIFTGGYAIAYSRPEWPRWKTAVTVGLLITVLDVFIEQSAPHLGFWQFYEEGFTFSPAPLHNYIGWWCVGTLLAFFSYPSYSKGRNRIALPFLIVQFTFFGVLFFQA